MHVQRFWEWSGRGVRMQVRPVAAGLTWSCRLAAWMVCTSGGRTLHGRSSLGSPKACAPNPHDSTCDCRHMCNIS